MKALIGTFGGLLVVSRVGTAATAGSCGRLLGHFQTEELPGESG
jgi:hypothetical protein